MKAGIVRQVFDSVYCSLVRIPTGDIPPLHSLGHDYQHSLFIVPVVLQRCMH